MGKYDKFYESYYKKLNSSGNEREVNFYYDENSYLSSYSKKQKKSTGRMNIFIFISLFTLGGVGVYKLSQTEMGENLYNTFLEAVSSVEIVERKEESKRENKSENVDITSSKESTSKELVSSVFNEEGVNSDNKYTDFVSALNGVTIKAKSEQGLVLSCKYKIIATSLPGMIEEIGENAEGDFLIIDHGNNIKTAYYNLPEVKYVKGEALKKGEKITEIKEERDIVFKIKENDEFVAPRMYLDFIE